MTDVSRRGVFRKRKEMITRKAARSSEAITVMTPRRSAAGRANFATKTSYELARSSESEKCTTT